MSRFLRVWPGPLGADHAVDLVWVNGAIAVGEGTDHHRGAYLDAGFDDDAALTASSLALRGHHDVEIVEDDESWWDGWRDHARPVTCLDIVVNPAWRPRPPVSAGATVLDIDPGRSFGSGAHVTTQLALEALQTQRLAGARVLDVGSGSGVLGIAAALLGASAVTAVDTDPAALVATTANAARNGVQGVVVIGDVGSGASTISWRSSTSSLPTSRRRP